MLYVFVAAVVLIGLAIARVVLGKRRDSSERAPGKPELSTPVLSSPPSTWPTPPDSNDGASDAAPASTWRRDDVRFTVYRPASVIPLTEDEFIIWCRTQIAANKYPRYVQFRDSLPIGSTGKIFKRALKEEFQQ